VAVAIHVDRYVRMRLQGFRGLVEHGGVLRTDICLVEVKVDATQDDFFRWWRRWWRWRRRRRRWWWGRWWRRAKEIASQATDERAAYYACGNRPGELVTMAVDCDRASRRASADYRACACSEQHALLLFAHARASGDHGQSGQPNHR